MQHSALHCKGSKISLSLSLSLSLSSSSMEASSPFPYVLPHKRHLDPVSWVRDPPTAHWKM